MDCRAAAQGGSANQGTFIRKIKIKIRPKHTMDDPRDRSAVYVDAMSGLSVDAWYECRFWRIGDDVSIGEEPCDFDMNVGRGMCLEWKK